MFADFSSLRMWETDFCLTEPAGRSQVIRTDRIVALVGGRQTNKLESL